MLKCIYRLNYCEISPNMLKLLRHFHTHDPLSFSLHNFEILFVAVKISLKDIRKNIYEILFKKNGACVTATAVKISSYMCSCHSMSSHSHTKRKSVNWCRKQRFKEFNIDLEGKFFSILSIFIVQLTIYILILEIFYVLLCLLLK